MFWLHYPWWRHLRSGYDTFPYLPPDHTQGSQESQESQESQDIQDIRHLTYPAERSTLQAVCHFLRTHFAYETPGPHPTLCFTPETLLGPMDHLLILYEGNKRNDSPSSGIIGTIRYHFTGFLWEADRPAIYLVDAFCLHPAHRHHGKGAVLLHALHRLANGLGLPHALFLKEGRPLLPLPLRSGRYRYRRCHRTMDTVHVTPVTPKQAHRWIHVHQMLSPTLLILAPPDAPNQQWYVYRSAAIASTIILACLQDTHQRTSEERMGWITVWLETPNVTDDHRREAANAFADGPHGFDWLWITLDTPDTLIGWQDDGPFHWYSFQWTASTASTRGGIMN
jgi:hypothetical protein